MKIVRAEAWRVSLPLEEPYAIAYESADTAENVFLRLETDDGHVGFGCAAPSEAVTGETPAASYTVLRDEVAWRIGGMDAVRYRRVLESFRDVLFRFPAARAALDMALLDLAAKRAELPLWQFLGGYRARIPTSITIGILPERETVARAKDWVARGFRCLKLKGGGGWEDDAARVRRVREAVGSDIAIRFDANQGFDAEGAIRFALQTASANVELIEQPTKASDLAALAQVSARSRIPVMADESLTTVSDAVKLVTSRAARLFNVKLMKVGGITDALPVLGVAQEAGIGVMIGCMDEAALGIAAGLALALASPAVQYADLDGHIGLIGDSSQDAVRLEDGQLVPSDRPGLGASL